MNQREIRAKEFQDIYNAQRYINQATMERTAQHIALMNTQFKPKIFDDINVQNKIVMSIRKIKDQIAKITEGGSPPTTEVTNILNEFSGILEAMNSTNLSSGAKSLATGELMNLVPHLQSIQVTIIQNLINGVDDIFEAHDDKLFGKDAGIIAQTVYSYAIIQNIMDKINSADFKLPITLHTIKIEFNKFIQGHLKTQLTRRQLMTINEILNEYLKMPGNILAPLLQMDIKKYPNDESTEPSVYSFDDDGDAEEYIKNDEADEYYGDEADEYNNDEYDPNEEQNEY